MAVCISTCPNVEHLRFDTGLAATFRLNNLITRARRLLVAGEVFSARRTAPHRTQTVSHRPDGGVPRVYRGYYRGEYTYQGPSTAPVLGCFFLGCLLFFFRVLARESRLARWSFIFFYSARSAVLTLGFPGAREILSWPSGHVR